MNPLFRIPRHRLSARWRGDEAIPYSDRRYNSPTHIAVRPDGRSKPIRYNIYAYSVGGSRKYAPQDM